MTEPLADLALPYRLALSYAPKSARENILTLMLLDERMAAVLRGGSEPMVMQLKLAWWRDRLRESPSEWPKGEPLLSRLARWSPGTNGLDQLADGWEVLLGDDLSADAIEEHADARAFGWCALARYYSQDVVLAREAARVWAATDLALNLTDETEIAGAKAVASGYETDIGSLGRELRPLAVLAALAQRNLRRGSDQVLDGPGAMMTAMRVGMVGR